MVAGDLAAYQLALMDINKYGRWCSSAVWSSEGEKCICTEIGGTGGVPVQSDLLNKIDMSYCLDLTDGS